MNEVDPLTAILGAGAIAGAVWGLWRWPIGPLCNVLRTIAVFIVGKPPSRNGPGRKGILDWQDDMEAKVRNLNRHVGNGDRTTLRTIVEDSVGRLDAIEANTKRERGDYTQN